MAWLHTWRRTCGGLLVAAVCAGGCTLVTDVGDFEQAPADATADADAGPQCAFESDERRDMNLRLTQFSPHADHDVEIRVVSTEDPPILRSVARLLPLAANETLVEMPNAIPAGSHQLDFYADVENTGNYTPPQDNVFVDHSWSIAPCLPEAEFGHTFDFDLLVSPVVPGDQARIRFEGMPLADVRLEVRVIEESTGATVGLVRLPQLLAADFEVTVDGVIDPDFSYRVAFYIDINGNNAYDPPPVDESMEITGITDGVDVSFVYDPGDFVDVEF